MIITSSVIVYPTKDIKKSLNTQISELSSDGAYDYLPTPKFTIISPVGSETIYKDSGIQIQWQTDALPSMPCSSLYYTYNDKDFNFISQQPNLETSSFFWNTSEYFDVNLPLTSSYKLYVSGTYESKSIFDSTDAFIITTRSLKLLDNGVRGFTADKDNIYPILWQSNGLSGFIDIIAAQVSVSYTTIYGNIKVPIVTVVTESIAKNYPNPDTERFDWAITSSQFKDGNVIIGISDSIYTNLAASASVMATTHLISTASGYKLSFPIIQSMDAQGIFKYKEYAIEILDDIGVSYVPRSSISLSGSFGGAYVSPKIKFIPLPQDTIILGERKLVE
jgi:hypothetical protein